jgi:hypothetical protein
MVYTINVYGTCKAEDKTYGTNDMREAYDTRDFWIAEGFTAIVTR